VGWRGGGGGGRLGESTVRGGGGGGDQYSWVNLLSVPKGWGRDRYKSPGSGAQDRTMMRKFLSFSVLSGTLR